MGLATGPAMLLRNTHAPMQMCTHACTHVFQGDDEDIVIEYVSAPLEFDAATADDSAADDDAMGLGYGGGLGFSKPKASYLQDQELCSMRTVSK